MLPTDYQNQILNNTMSNRRQYQMINNPNGTVSFIDVTVYNQIGSTFDSDDINAITGQININITNIDSLQTVINNGIVSGLKGTAESTFRTGQVTLTAANVDAYSKAEINALLDAVTSLGIVVIEELPTENIRTDVIYLIPSENAQDNNSKDEYINIDGTTNGWEQIGSTSVNLENYYTKTEVDALINGRGGGHAIQNEGNSTSLPQRATMVMQGPLHAEDNSEDETTELSVDTNADLSDFLIPRGGNRLAKTPVGTVISYFGDVAPDGYLACNGAVYNKADYPALAAHLANLSTASQYAVDGDDTKFKVPDLRGEFLRGTGTNSHTDQGSGASVGTHQDATNETNVFVWNKEYLLTGIANEGSAFNTSTTNTDTFKNRVSNAQTSIITGGGSSSVEQDCSSYTARPTNTSVLFCIAYRDIYLAPQHQYSTDEQVVGRWIDGRNVYEKTFWKNVGITTGLNTLAHNISNLGKITKIEGMGKREDGYFMPIPTGSIQTENIPWSVMLNGGDNTAIQFSIGENYVSPYSFTEIYITMQYTKTTDTV